MQPFDAITQQIISLLEQGVVPWRKPWAYREGEFPSNPVSKRAYRGINLFTLHLVQSARGYRSPCWCTFNQADAQGWHVKRGEKGSLVVFWKPPLGADGKIDRERPWLLRSYWVFNFDQIEGAEVPVHDPVCIPDPVEEAERVAAAYVASGGPEAKRQGGRAFYRPGTDEVFVPPMDAFDSPGHFYATLFHELGHSTGHAKRLNRAGVAGMGDSHFGSETYAKEELVAEMTASFLCGHAGIADMQPHNAAYIAGWLKALQNDKRMVVSAASLAQSAADFILGKKAEEDAEA